MRLLRFICLCISLRSVSCARWVMAYDDFKPNHKK